MLGVAQRLAVILGIVFHANLVRVNTQALRVRAEPSVSSEKLTTVFRDTILPVLDEQNGWQKVQFVDIVGWVSSQYTVHVADRELFHDPAQAQDFVKWVVDCEDLDPYNGYYFHGYCLPGLISPDSALIPYPQHSSGRVAYYDAGIMRQVAKSRGLSLKGFVGGVALESCAEIGRTVYIKFASWTGPYRVVDCGARYGLFRVVVYSEYVVEVSADILADLTASGQWRNTVEVCMDSPSCTDTPVPFKSYWLDRVEFVRQSP